MKVVSLASGSKGNAYLVESGGRLLLIDCGISCRTLAERMRRTGFDLSALIGVAVTHNHHDHIDGLPMLHRKMPDVPVFANLMTAEAATATNREVPEDMFTLFENGQEFELGPFAVHPFSIPHDVPDPVGFLVKADGKTYFHATDLGMPLKSVGFKLREADVATLESNHDVTLLRRSGRHISLIQRIAGNRGHLSNYQAAEMVEEFAGEKLRKLFLAHLSQDCNVPHLALKETGEALARRGLAAKVDVETLEQFAPGRVYDAGL